MGKIEFYFVRHGETEWNKDGRLQGWLDSPLTNKGRESALRLSDFLQMLNFDAVYSSTSGRAIETARILNEQSLEIQMDKRLQEIQLGAWQGQYIQHILKEDGARYLNYCNEPDKYQPNGGETFDQVSTRMVEFLNHCISRYKNGRILVVTHAVAIRCLLLVIQNLSISQIWKTGEIEGTSVTKIIVENKEIRVEYIGRIFHNHLKM
ncbi:phosphoglycerate mutase [Lysinibacillus sp. PLM2]|nr:phosphoglycerate mutase [Lysinibacillus sp. PLM2]